MVNLRAIVPNPDGVLLPGIFLRGDIYQGVLPNAPVVIAMVFKEKQTALPTFTLSMTKAPLQDVT